ncbi:hypothetical protein [Nostoc sp.]
MKLGRFFEGKIFRPVLRNANSIFLTAANQDVAFYEFKVDAEDYAIP